MSFIYQDGAVGIKADWFPFISKLFVGEKINPLQAFMQDFPIPGASPQWIMRLSGGQTVSWQCHRAAGSCPSLEVH